MIKRSILLISLLASGVSADTSGTMNCTVKSQILLSIQDGKPIDYPGYGDSLVLGDKLDFLFEYSKHEDLGEIITLALVDAKREKALYAIPIRIEDLENQQSKSVDLLNWGEVKMGALESDLIKISDNRGNIILERYYKNDWQGVFFGGETSTGTAVYAITFDCRQGEGDYGDFLPFVIEKSH